MASNLHLATVARNRFLDQLNTDIGASGRLRIYDGTQPTDANTALGAQNLLADLPLSATAFAAAASGQIAAAAITSANAGATGTATWGSFTTSAGTRVLDFSVGTATADLVLNSVAISSGASVAVSAFTLNIPA